MSDYDLPRELLDGIIDSIEDGAALYDANDKLVRCNASYIAYFPRVADIILPGMAYRTLIENLARTGSWEGTADQIQTQVDERVGLFEHGSKNNEIYHAESLWARVDYYKIAIGGTFVITADVTERKAMEVSLAEANQKLEARVDERTAELKAANQRLIDFTETASDWLWEMDADLRFIYFSDLDSETPERDKNLYIGKTRQDISGDFVNTPEWQSHIEDLEAHRPFRDFTYKHLDENGQPVFISIGGKPIFNADGTFNGYRGTGTDLTKQHRITDEMKKSELLFQGLFDAAMIGVVLHSEDGKSRVRVNQGFCEMVGYSEDYLLKDAYENLTYPNDLPLSLELRRQLRHGEIDHFVAEKRYICKGGDVLWCSVLQTVIRDEQGNVINYISFIQNIMQRKADEEALLAIKNEAEIANRAKSNFLANMSHELRTPLNSIIGFSSIIASEMFGEHRVAAYGEYGQNIKQSGEHLLQLINEILDLARVEAETLEVNWQQIDVFEVITSCIEMTDFEIKKADLKMVVESPDEPLIFSADALHMKQIILNLLSNAVKFTPKKGMITLQALIDHEGSVVVAISDTGIGIAQEDIPRIVEPFSQVTDSMTRDHDGAGLGLAIVKSLTELNGGELQIDSTIGDGTTVTLRFPRERS